MTDYTTPSSSLADTVPPAGSKMEESLVANVSHSCYWYLINPISYLAFLPLILFYSCAVSAHVDFT